MLYVPFTKLSTEDENALRELFQTKVGEAVSVTVREVKEMVLTNRAKYRLIIQEAE